MARDVKLVDSADVDTTSIESFVKTATRGCKTDREKMIALWAAITRRPYYHWCEARENPEGITELGVVYDPMTAFNVYGTVICYQVADLLANLGDAAGIKTRTREVPGHKLTEAFYDGRWHLFDAQYDLQSYFVADDGKTIIDLAELCKDADKYINKPRFPSDPFFQFDKHGGKFWPWETKKYVIEKFYHPGVPAKADVYVPYISRGYTVHLDLRRGEKLVRHFTNQGKWYCPEEFVARWSKDPTQRWVLDGPHDPRNPKNTYANGELIYDPDWAAAETNFLDGLHRGKNFVLTKGTVYPQGRGSCEVVFRVQSPYLLVGNPGELKVDGDSRDGAIFQADFLRKGHDDGNAVAVSVDNGITWMEVWRNPMRSKRTVRLDLTRFVEGRYEYLVRVSLKAGAPQGAGVSALKMRNALFLSPVPLPAVKPGSNRFAFSLVEGKGVTCIRPDLSDRRNYRQSFHELKDLKHGSSWTGRLSPARGKQGYAVIEVAPPPGTQVEWLSVHGSFAVSTRNAKAEAAEILYATDPAGEWTSAWKSDFSRRHQKWRWDRTVTIRLKKPAEKCYVKFLLKRRHRMSLNMFRIYAHTLRPGFKLKPGSVTVTHDWVEDGQARTHALRPDLAGQDYTVVAKGKDIKNKSVTIEVANER